MMNKFEFEYEFEFMINDKSKEATYYCCYDHFYIKIMAVKRI